MSTLQESRRELMVQLEQLMMLLKVLQTLLNFFSHSRLLEFPRLILHKTSQLWFNFTTQFLVFHALKGICARQRTLKRNFVTLHCAI